MSWLPVEHVRNESLEGVGEGEWEFGPVPVVLLGSLMLVDMVPGVPAGPMAQWDPSNLPHARMLRYNHSTGDLDMFRRIVLPETLIRRSFLVVGFCRVDG